MKQGRTISTCISHSWSSSSAAATTNWGRTQHRNKETKRGLIFLQILHTRFTLPRPTPNTFHFIRGSNPSSSSKPAAGPKQPAYEWYQVTYRGVKPPGCETCHLVTRLRMTVATHLLHLICLLLLHSIPYETWHQTWLCGGVGGGDMLRIAETYTGIARIWAERFKTHSRETRHRWDYNKQWTLMILHGRIWWFHWIWIREFSRDQLISHPFLIEDSSARRNVKHDIYQSNIR
jgi:hypothetical protein